MYAIIPVISSFFAPQSLIIYAAEDIFVVTSTVNLRNDSHDKAIVSIVSFVLEQRLIIFPLACMNAFGSFKTLEVIHW